MTEVDNDDARFWAGILAKFSETLLHRDRLQRERDEHDARARDFLRQTAQWMQIPVLLGSEPDQCITTKRLLSERLNVITANIEDLRTQTAALEKEKQQLSEEHARFVAQQNELLAKALRDVDRLHVDSQEASSRHAESSRAREVCFDAKIATLEQSLQAAREENEQLRMQNAQLQHRLASADVTREEGHAERLKQENENLRNELHRLKGLKDSNVTFLTDLHERMPHTTPSPSSAVVKTLKASTSLSTTAPTRIFLKLPAVHKPLKEEGQTTKEPENDTTLVHISATSSRPPYATPIPRARWDSIKSFTQIVLDPSDNIDQEAQFTRSFLSQKLGGSHQPLIVKVGRSQTSLAEKHGLTSYLCPNLDLNPWAPTIPGEHGYMFVGLGSEKHTFVTPEIHHVFVGFKNTSGKVPRLFRYMGIYSACRVDALTREEWSTLSNNVQQAYAQVLKGRRIDSRAVSDILEDYEAGKLVVPCVQLKCIGYSEGLASDLATLVKAPEDLVSTIPPGPIKRRRIEHETNEEHPSRRNFIASSCLE